MNLIDILNQIKTPFKIYANISFENLIVEMLPTEILHGTARDFLDVRSIGRLSCVSKFWQNLLTDVDIWQTKISRDFNIDKNL